MCNPTSGSNHDDPVEGSVPKGSISKYLVSSDLSPDDQVRHIKRLLKDKGERSGAERLEPGDALRFIDLLDEVLRTGRLNPGYRPRCIHYLAHVCGWHGILPSSAKISNHKRNPGLPHRDEGRSETWLGTHDGRKVVIRKQFYSLYDEEEKRSITSDFCKKAVMWKHLSHPNIVPFLGATMETERDCENWEIVYEFMENGGIGEFLELNQGVNKLELLKGVAAGLSYLHSQSVVRECLRKENILINKDGHACLIPRPFAESGRYGDPSSVLYVSPEMSKQDDGKIMKESDVYALGILIYEIICGHKPHHPTAGYLAAVRLRQGDFPSKPEVGFTDSLWEVTKRCWHRVPKIRPSAHAVMNVLDEALRA